MYLAEALNVERGDVISLVGAGGKTTAMYRLAAELVSRGWRVITTTTTHIFPPRSDQSPRLLSIGCNNVPLSRVQQSLDRYRHVTLAAHHLPTGKLRGLDPAMVAAFAEIADVTIIEADGSKGRPFKAPADHEPVVPESTSILVPVAGMDVIGCPLVETYVHRSVLAAELAGIPLATTITPDIVARVLGHPDGGPKGAPPDAVVCVFLNKVENEPRQRQAEAVAQCLLSTAPIDRVIVGSVARCDPVSRVYTQQSFRECSLARLGRGSTARDGPFDSQTILLRR